MIKNLFSKDSTPSFKKYLANTTWLITERTLRLLITFFIGVYIARYLGPDQFGVLSYALSYIAIFMAIGTLGLDSIIVKYLVINPEMRSDVIGTAFYLKLVGTFLMWILLALSLMLVENDTLTTNIIGILALSTIFHAFNVIDYSFQAEVKSKYVTYVLFSQLIFSSVAKLFLINTQLPLIWFSYIYFLDALLVALGLCIIFLWNNNKISLWTYKSHLGLKLLKQSWPLMLSSIAVTLYMRIDQIMIKEMLGIKDVGIYSVAVQLSEAFYFIPIVITASLFPAIINAKKIDLDYYDKQMKRLYSLMIWGAIIIAVAATFISPWLIPLLYGNEYSESAQVLTINIWAGVFVFLGLASGKWLINENLQMFAMYRTLLGLFINIFLNLLLIKSHGIYGAAISTLISQFVAAYFFDLLHPKTRHSFFLKSSAFLYPFTTLKKHV